MDTGSSLAVNNVQFQRRWVDYYQAVAGRPPRETLVTALNHFATESKIPRRGRVGFAVDLGCGDGRDTVEMLRRRWPSFSH